MELHERVMDLLEDAQTDPNGSYTGIVTDDPLSTPVQDADDL